jgi:predicted DCC family thiol-disulfide oxidoreductase YuxK
VTTVATAADQDRDAHGVPVRGLTVLYDAQCSLCTLVRDWLVRQRQLVPLELVPAGSDEARRRFPSLDHQATLDEITVVGDAGQVYRGSAAWIVCLWALREHRPLAHRLSTPAGTRLARGAVLAAAKWRESHNSRAEARTQWGGSTYYNGEGWAYDRRYGWTYTPPPSCDSGTCSTR